MRKLTFLTLFVSLFHVLHAPAQVAGRWYSYGQYANNEAITFGETLNEGSLPIWNDTTALFNNGGVGYYNNTFTSVGMSFAPRLTPWNAPSVYGSTIEVGPADVYVIDSVRIYGSYMRNPAKTAPVDTLRLGFVYGNGTATTNLPSYYFSGGMFLSDFGYDTILYLQMIHDSLHNTAGSYTGVVTAPYIQSILLHAADTATTFMKSYALTTPLTVPAGYCAAAALSFKSGDASYTPFDTVEYLSGAYKYGDFLPAVGYVGFSGFPEYPIYNPPDSNVGYFKIEGAGDVGWGGYYIPTWAWIGGGPSELQYPLIDFHITCATCAYTDTIAGPTSVCVGSTITLTTGLTGGSWSSSTTSIATVGSSSGVVSGIAAGVVTISYTVSGHSAVVSVTVDTAPTALGITGSSFICISTGADTIDLSASVGGGVWSSSNPGVAYVVSGGLVYGFSSGTAVISYTITNACGTYYATHPVTVSAASAGTISGAPSVCAGSTVALSDAIPGGTWSSSAPGVGTVNSAGVVGGVSTGTAIISYTVGSGSCTSYATFVVNVQTAPDNPGAISGPSTVCIDSAITLSETISGGAWSATNTDATASGGIITGVTGGADSIEYTVSNACGSVSVYYLVTVDTCSNVSVRQVTLAAQGVSVFPNPAHTEITVQAGVPITGIVINDLLGRQVFSGAYNDRSVTINLATLPEGVYVVKVNNTSVSMLVKQ